MVAFLLLLGVPFLGVNWGFPDERVLPPSASARQVADMLDNDFANGLGAEVTVVVPDARGLKPVDLRALRRRVVPGARGVCCQRPGRNVRGRQADGAARRGDRVSA